MKKILIALVLFLNFIFSTNNVWARTNVTDWYIKNFETEIVVNSDSTLLITEKITADCGNATGKHGIFRVLPTVLKTPSEIIKMPVELISITDFSGKKWEYSTQKDYTNNTVTWKIGDANKTVTGENTYLIKYKVKNTINFKDANVDELYWNLSGNFWELEIDNFTGKIIFPNGVNKNNSKIDYYTGSLGSKNKDGAKYLWSSDNILEFSSTKTLRAGEGITASINVPKNIFKPYVPSFWEKYALYLWLFLPAIVFLVCFNLWKKYGEDPKINQAVVAEFSAPEKLSPIDLGVLYTNGRLKPEFVSASIINLAVKGIIQIEETKGLGFLNIGKDYKLKIIDSKKIAELSASEGKLQSEIFEGQNEIMLSALKNKFYLSVQKIRKVAINELEKNQLIKKTGLTWQVVLLAVSFLLIPFSIFLFSIFPESVLAMIVSILMIFVFSFLMPQRTQRGAEVNHQIKGFKLYIETAEKYRAEFYEKENMFEKILPYAIMFGLTKQWIKKMQEIYGEDYFQTHAPIWFLGSSMTSFNADEFASKIDSLSSAMASNVSSGSGSGGGGFSGGGGGGGGGGGW